MRKVLIFLGIMIVLFVGVAVLTNMQNKEKVTEDTPYGKATLHPETVAQLDDKNYQNLILPDELEKKMDDKEDITVYFYSPTCPHCQRTTPIVDPLSRDMGINLVQYNLLEFEQGWDDYLIEETPTIVQYKEGKEVARITGYNEEPIFKQWFTENSQEK